MGRKSTTAAQKAIPRKAPFKAAYSVEQLRPYCRDLFGVSLCAYAGATSGLAGRYTVDEMKAIIGKWKEKEVK